MILLNTNLFKNKKVRTIFHLPTYLPNFLSTYSSTALPACLYMGNTIVSLCLPFPCRNASHSDSSTDLLLTVFLIATFILPPQSPLGYLRIFLSGYIRCIPPLFVVVRLPLVVYIDTSKTVFFSMKPVICGQQSIFPAQQPPKVSLVYSLDPASGPYPQYGLILFYFESFQYFPPRTHRSHKEIFPLIFFQLKCCIHFLIFTLFATQFWVSSSK